MNIRLLLEEIRWLKRRKLYLFLFVTIVRLFLSFFGRRIKWWLFRKLKLNKVKQILKLDSRKILLRIMDVNNVKEIWEWKVYDAFTLNKKSIVVDIGAHIGLFTIKVAPFCKKIIAVEPEPENFELLTTNVYLNRIYNVKLLNKAVGAKRGTEKLYGCGSGASMIRKSYDVKVVKVVKLEDILKNLKKIDLLKIDVEGAEHLIIQASKTKLLKISQIVIEIHPSLTDEESIKFILLKNGFKLEKYPSTSKDTYILYAHKK